MSDDIQNNVNKHAVNDLANIPTASHDIPKPQAHKIGEEHAMGMLRLGAHELTPALQALPDSNIRPMEEPGVFGNENAPHIVEADYEAKLHEYSTRRAPEQEMGIDR